MGALEREESGLGSTAAPLVNSISRSRTNTIFERSKVPLNKWLYAMYLLVTARKGISSTQLAKEIGVTQKTAWFIQGRETRAQEGREESEGSTLDSVFRAARLKLP